MFEMCISFITRVGRLRIAVITKTLTSTIFTIKTLLLINFDLFLSLKNDKLNSLEL